MKEKIIDFFWFCIEVFALLCFVVFATLMKCIFLVTDLFRKEEVKNGKYKKKY